MNKSIESSGRIVRRAGWGRKTLRERMDANTLKAMKDTLKNFPWRRGDIAEWRGEEEGDWTLVKIISVEVRGGVAATATVACLGDGPRLHIAVGSLRVPRKQVGREL